MLTKKKKRKDPNKIRNERKKVTINITEIQKKIIREQMNNYTHQKIGCSRKKWIHF